jgi:hypothetical protein
MTEKNKINPRNDPDVQRGYEEHQKWYKEKNQTKSEKGEKELKSYEVDPSGSTTRGPSKKEN